MTTGYLTAVQNLNPVCELKSTFYVFLQEMDVNWRKMLIFPHRRALAGFTYWTSVRWPVVIFSWHRYQFNCKLMLLLNQFSELGYHGYFLISHCLNLALNSGNSGRDLMIWNLEHTASLNVSTPKCFNSVIIIFSGFVKI